jgi:drug/metabolite transporter (DMT)-like permease
MRTGNARRGALLVAAAACCWSSGGLIARLVATDPWTTSFWRGICAAAFLTAVAALRARRSGDQRRRLGWPAWAFACSIAVASTCFLLALRRTSVANTLVVMSSGPYLAGLLAWLFLGERVRPRSWVAMAITVAGTAVMVSGSRATGHLAGDALAIGMAAAFAAGVVVVRANPDVPMTPAVALGALLASAFALPFAEPLSVGARDLGLLALFGLGQFAAGFLLFTAGAPLIPAAEASLIGLLETALGPLWVWLALGEEPGPRTLIGGAMVLGAMLVHTALDFVSPRADAGIHSPAKI